MVCLLSGLTGPGMFLMKECWLLSLLSSASVQMVILFSLICGMLIGFSDVKNNCILRINFWHDVHSFRVDLVC